MTVAIPVKNLPGAVVLAGQGSSEIKRRQQHRVAAV
jgi:hypothetical protein